MYGLKQAAILAYDNLVKNLHTYGYNPITHTLGLWKQETTPITLCLCVYDFGIKYFNKSDAIQLLQYLQINYTVMVDWSGKKYVVLPSIVNITMDMSMCQCHVMYKKNFKRISINHQNHTNFHRVLPHHMSNISGESSHMHQKSIHPHCSPLPKLQGCKKLLTV